MNSLIKKYTLCVFLIAACVSATVLYTLLFIAKASPQLLDWIDWGNLQIPTSPRLSWTFQDAAKEEIIFRFIPILSAYFICRRRLTNTTMWLTNLATSTVFGLAHGGIFFLLLQGVLGFLLASLGIVVFKLTRNIIPAYIAETCAHALHNVVLFMIGVA